MEKIKDILRRGCWGMFLRDLFIAIYVIVSIPALWILYVYDLLDMNKAELIATYWSLLLVAGLPFVLLVWVVVLLRRKIEIGYMYIRPDKKMIARLAGITIYEKVNDEGKSKYSVKIKRQAVKDFILNFMIKYDLLGQETADYIAEHNKDDYEEMVYNFVKNDFDEWVMKNMNP